jgi:hypothetical protein
MSREPSDLDASIVTARVIAVFTSGAVRVFIGLPRLGPWLQIVAAPELAPLASDIPGGVPYQAQHKKQGSVTSKRQKFQEE